MSQAERSWDLVCDTSYDDYLICHPSMCSVRAQINEELAKSKFVFFFLNCLQRPGGSGSRRLLYGLAPPRRPTRAAATGM